MGYYNVGWVGSMYTKTCYEVLDEGGVMELPFEWVNGKKHYPYGRYVYNVKQLAKYRKDHINNPHPFLKHIKNTPEYNWMGEPCKRCQIKDKCDEGFPTVWDKIRRFLRGDGNA